MTRLLAAFAALLLTALPLRAAVDIQEVTSPQGITAWLVEERSIPFVALEIRFGGGANLDAPGKRGATNMMVGLLEEGSGALDARGFAAAVDALAASFSFDTNDDSASVSARFLTENRDAAVALLRGAITDPTFAEPDIERIRAQVLAGIASDLKDPDTIVARTFYGLTYPGHPYASAREGTIESVTALTRDDLVAAHQALFARDRIYVSAVGDIDAEELGALLDTLFGGLPETGAPMPEQATYALEPGLTVVPFDTPQSVALFGHQGIERDDPDFFPAFVANQIFGGGGFGSRLTEEVREKRGLTYGISTFLAPRDYGALVLGQVASANERIADSISVIRDEWRRISENGVTEAELEQAKTYLTGAYPLRFDGNGTIARILVGMQQSDLTPEYIETRNDQVMAVTLDDIRRVAARVYDADALHFVVVGQPVGLEPGN